MSRILSYVLRHRPEAIGLHIDPEGWVDVPQLLEALNHHGHPWTLHQLEQVVREDTKQRYRLENGRIRAQQGHSLSVDLGLEPALPPSPLYHGTTRQRWTQIQQSGGLNAGRRQHVHLSHDLATARQVGNRHRGEELLLLQVDSAAMQAEGWHFYRSANGVWLTDRVPLAYLEPIGQLTPEEHDG